MTDQQLLEAWYGDRGVKAGRESAATEKAILPALRDRWARECGPTERHHCPVCNLLTRGGGHRLERITA
jgi:hypothetical protein